MEKSVFGRLSPAFVHSLRAADGRSRHGRRSAADVAIAEQQQKVRVRRRGGAFPFACSVLHSLCGLPVVDSGSHKVQHFFNAISLKIKASLLTIDGPPENSSDLERAHCARSNGDEFSGGPSMFTEIWRCEV